ncbi:MAG: flagellar biosynthesis protein FlgN [Treponema bryantii]|nr:flagellar biosynthesis protein FlgN [Treponema bryantii]
MAEISHEELLERVALLRKFKSVLEQQRNKFKEYLSVLEKQQNSIESENPETILAHTELEQQVVKNISNLQKVIVPMSKMYKSLGVSQNQMPEIEHIQNIQKDLADLQNKVLVQNQINRDLLRVHINQIKTQIQNFNNPYKNARSVYAQTERVASLVQVEA